MSNEEKIITLDSTGKKLNVNLENIEDLVNIINYATNQLKEAKEGNGTSHDYALVKKRIDLVIEIINNYNETYFPNFEKRVDRQLKKLPNEETIKTLVFELDKLKGIDTIFQKFKTRSILLSIFITALTTTLILSYVKVDDKLLHKYLMYQIKKNNYILPKAKYELSSKNSTKITFNKK